MSGIRSKKKEEARYRVCIVSAILPPAYGGAEVAAFQYALRLRKDPQSDVIVIGWDRTGVYKESGNDFDFVHPVTFPENLHDAGGVLIYLQQYAHMLRCFISLLSPMWKYRDRYDYIHNFNSGFAFNRVSILIARLLGKKVVTETSLVGDDDPFSLGRFLDWKDYFKPKYVRYLFYKMADAYVSKSSVITDIFRKSEIPMNKVYEISYAVDTDLFKPADEKLKSELRNKLGIWEKGKLILFVGGINERKGVHILVDAFAEVADESPELHLLIAGPTYKYDQKYIETIKGGITEKGLDGRIRFTEKSISNVDEYMRASDIFVLPSKKEGFPISVIEAMSTGLAVIGSDIPEIAEAQIDDGVDGLVFEQGDHMKLADAFRSLFLDSNLMANLGAEARKKAVSNWSTEIVDRKYRELYSNIRGLPGYQESQKVSGLSNNLQPGKKIKILFNIPNFNTAGSGRALLNVIERLDKNSFEPEICCRHSKGELFTQAQSLGIPIHIAHFTTLMKPRGRAFRNVVRLSKFFKKLNPDIIHSYNYSDDYSEALAARLAGIKWIYTKKNMGWGSNAWKMRTRLASVIIPQNTDMVEAFFPSEKNLHLIPIGIDISEFANNENTDFIRSKYNLVNSDPIIITIANVIPIKGIEFLINGFSLILDELPNAKLLIVGEDKTEYADLLKSEIAGKGLLEKVIFTGRQGNIKPFFKAADIFILSSTKAGEGGPISVLEAMASGVLSYGSDVPGIRDQFKEFQDQLFESENPGAIANKILHAMRLTQKEKKERIRKQTDFIMKNYSVENEVSKLEELYKLIASDSGINGRTGVLKKSA
ncbi:MAG: glycosyltransferase [Ignavibacteria bacterium]|nr:glycosyltransferase [Ignavibacteria bacterium]